MYSGTARLGSTTIILLCYLKSLTFSQVPFIFMQTLCGKVKYYGSCSILCMNLLHFTIYDKKYQRPISEREIQSGI